MKLNRASFERAVAFLMTDGRKLEQTLFRYFFEDGSAQDCIDALAAHQTETGGFIEMGEGGIDGPTPIGSTIAFQHLIDLPNCDCVFCSTLERSSGRTKLFLVFKERRRIYIRNGKNDTWDELRDEHIYECFRQQFNTVIVERKIPCFSA